MSLYQQLINCPLDTLKEIIKNNYSKRDIIRTFGFKGNDPRAIQYVTKIIRDNNIDISHHTHRWHPNRGYTINDVKEAVRNAECFTDVLRYLTLSEVGGNFQTIKRIIKNQNIDISHFLKNPNNRKRKQVIIDEVLVENSKIPRNSLRRLILRENVIPYICDICENKGMWQNKHMTLDLDHKNGIRNDNRPNNLRFLCPNCHSQTATYRGKNNTATLPL